VYHAENFYQKTKTKNKKKKNNGQIAIHYPTHAYGGVVHLLIIIFLLI